MSRNSVLGVVYGIFWSAVLVALAVSLHLGLNSTYIWYTEKTSFNMYLATTLFAVIILEATVVLFFLERRRSRAVETSRGGGPQFPQKAGRSYTPLIAMSVLFLLCSVFALAALDGYLLPNYKINTVFILFTGSMSKIAVGLFAVVAFRTGLRRTQLEI
ncbi:MAG: hypothetical protein LN415_09240 [Candidatus Thermoplasmatota archaeon]|nr:hypothetical protein [Candidatus Thermoplasmatota archaeon]